MGRADSLNIQKIEYIDGNALDQKRIKVFSSSTNTLGGPLVQFGSILNKYENQLYSRQPDSQLRLNIQKYTREENLYIVQVNDSYKFRPDLLSQIFYGTQEYFHVLLLLNGLKSFLEFIPDRTNNLIFVFKPEILAKL